MIAATRPRTGKRQLRTYPSTAFPWVLKEERRLREWTQRQMGEFLAVSQSTVARWELGSRHPTLAELERVGHHLKIAFHVG